MRRFQSQSLDEHVSSHGEMTAAWGNNSKQQVTQTHFSLSQSLVCSRLTDMNADPVRRDEDPHRFRGSVV